MSTTTWTKYPGLFTIYCLVAKEENMRIGISPIVDCVFKKLFGSTKNKNLSIELVNAVLRESGEPLVVDLEILNPYNPQNFLRDKLSIVDIKAKNERGEWFIIEVQVQMMEYFPERLLYYWAKKYQSQLQSGERYSLLKKVTLISICKNSLPINTMDYYNHFRISDTKKHIPFSDHLNIHTIELSKFPNTEENIGKPIEKWTYFLKHGENLDSENLPSPLSIPPIEQAVKELRMFTQSEIERDLYDSRHMAILDKNSALAEKYEKGLQKGIEKGKIEGILQAIESVLEIKFAAEGLKYMPKIREINDLPRLQVLLQIAKKAKVFGEIQCKIWGDGIDITEPEDVFFFGD